MKALLANYRTVIVANGAFPTHTIPLGFLRDAHHIICCDGAIEHLLAAGIEPDYIVGDLDSLTDEMRQTYSAILFHNPDQETNDLTKAVQFCMDRGWMELTILGATGKREDHTLGNMSLLLDYGKQVAVQLLTDYGVFVPQYEDRIYESFPGQQVSIVSLTPPTLFSVEGLRYPINERSLTSWWQGTLNKALSSSFHIHMTDGRALVFREYP